MFIDESYLLMKVKIAKEVIACEVLPVAMFDVSACNIILILQHINQKGRCLHNPDRIPWLIWRSLGVTNIGNSSSAVDKHLPQEFEGERGETKKTPAYVNSPFHYMETIQQSNNQTHPSTIWRQSNNQTIQKSKNQTIKLSLPP